MYFLKKNFLNIIIWTLLFGVAAVVFNILVPSHTYNYEEYYELTSEVEDNSLAEMNILLNDSVNQDFSHKAAHVERVRESDYLLFTINNVEREQINELRNSFHNIMDSAGVNATDSHGISVYFDGAYLTKFIIIASSLILGAIVGILFSLRGNKIRTEADIREYLNENTLGTF